VAPASGYTEQSALDVSVSTTDHHAATSPFAVAYRDNVGELTSFFARRVNEPQLVADLVSETFVEAIGSLTTFDPARGTARAWLFAIARRVFAPVPGNLPGRKRPIH
jgi:DNA-directed RNA polymerase specialized sigma24 family protein